MVLRAGNSRHFSRTLPAQSRRFWPEFSRFRTSHGIHIEEPGFGYRGNCFCELCQDRGERVLGRDWARWARYGWLDGYVPQIYTEKADLLDQRTRLVVGDLAADCQVSIGINISPPSIRPKNLTNEQLCRFAEIIRSHKAGVVLFHAGIFTDEQAAALSAGPFREPAQPPLARRLQPAK